MFQIPWHLYSEEEIQEVLTVLFKEKGYEVYNIHKIDRRGEKGVDLECSRQGEAEKLLISVKKNPRQKDVNQLNDFADKPVKTKIYVYTGEPSTGFKKVMEKVKDKISFWDSRKLTFETFAVDARFYLFMIIENYFEKDVWAITFSFCKFYMDFNEQGRRFGKPVKADRKMANLLWQIKDRSASLHKSLITLQTLFERMKPFKTDQDTEMYIAQAFLKSLSFLQMDSLKPLRELYLEFLRKYPANFEQFCIESKGRSNWKYFIEMKPQLLPGQIIKSFEEGKEMTQTMRELIPQTETKQEKERLTETLGDISRILASEAYWLEDTVDDLFKIGLTGKCR